jgi:hypothetical protein
METSRNNGALASTALGAWVLQRLSAARTNRGPLETRWNRLVASVAAERGDTPGGPVRKDEASTDWHSDDVFAFSRGKLRSATHVGEDVLLRGGQIPFEVEVPPTVRAGLKQERGDDLKRYESEARTELLEMIRLSRAHRELLDAWMDGAYLGESVIHVFEDRVPVTEWRERQENEWQKIEQLRIVPGVERVDPFECFRDIEFDTLEAGAYFFRVQPASLADIMALDKIDHISRAALIRAMHANGQATLGIDSHPQSAGDQSETPGRRLSMQRQRCGEMVEAWVWVPRKLVDQFAPLWQADLEIESVEDALAAGGGIGDGVGNLEPHEEGDQVYCQLFFANGELVGFNESPGALTYHREVWQKNFNGVDGFGVVDDADPYQRLITGATRAFTDNAKLISNFVLMINRSSMLTRPEDVFRNGGIIDIDPLEGDIAKAAKQLVFQDATASLLKSIEMFLNFGDISTNMPREYSGQQPDYVSTAYEVQRRLEQAGKYMISVARRFDGHVDRVCTHYAEYLSRRFPVRAYGVGFANVEELVVRMSKIMGMFDRIMTNPNLATWANMDWWLQQVSQLNDLPHDEAWKSAKTVAAEMKAQAESEERQLALAQLQADIEKSKAETTRLLAVASATEQRGVLDRARLARDASNDVAERETRAAEALGAMGDAAGGDAT